MCRDFYQDRQDKSRLSRQIEIFEIFEGNRDFFEINQDFFSLDRDILDFSKPGGLDLSRHGLDRDSRSRHF